MTTTAHARAVRADIAPAAISAPAAPALRVCHVMSADLWAGAEVQLATTAAYLVGQPSLRVSAVLFNDGPLARELNRLGVPVTVVDERRTTALGIATRLTQFFKDQQIDLVHTHRYKDSVLATLAAKMAGVPHVVRTVHGLREPMTGWSALKFRLYEALDRTTLLCGADLVIAVSRGMADTLRASGYRPTSVTQIPNGVDLNAIAPRRRVEDVRRELGIAPGAVVIGTAGRLSPVKGHAGLLRAARLMLDEQPDATFLIVGGGPLDAELREQAGRLGMARACKFTGAREDVHDLMAAMDIFVLPSLSEGMPMAALEAMALGRPVVATAVGGVPEVIQDRVNGLLVRVGDDRALADACVHLVRDRQYAGALGARAKQFVEERFSHEQSGGALLAAYRSVALIPRRNHERHERHERHEATRARGFVERASDRIVHSLARHALTRVRRNPAPIAARVRSARSVLIVCHGNIIRSAFAARVVGAALNGNRAVSVASAGLEAVPGRAVDPTALRVAKARGIDLGGHTAARVTPELVAASNVIFVMDVPQLVTLRRRCPDARQKTFLLTCLAPDTPLEVADPVDGDAYRFHECFDHITRATGPLIRAITSPPDR